ncbi:MAG TPA: sigma-70 family RNA polymerase sigma factor [Planctomycetota bacterium]|nr:sigma-70 family RNA polymerase sigma factor [Planctomycetota bacterium]
MRRARSGDGAAWTCLVQLHEAQILNLAAAILGHDEDARDVCQATFQLAWVKLSTCVHDGSFPFWVRRIALNQARDLLRKRKVRRDVFEVHEPRQGEAPSPEEILSGKESRHRILKALDGLPLELREPLILHLLEDRPYAELADILGISQNAARIRIHRGLIALRQNLQEDKS